MEDGTCGHGYPRSLMKMDYLAHHKFQPRKIWWSEDMPIEERSSIEQTLLLKTLLY